jgi:hypothetical protein
LVRSACGLGKGLFKANRLGLCLLGREWHYSADFLIDDRLVQLRYGSHGLDYLLLLLSNGLASLLSWSSCSLLVIAILDICLHLHKLLLILFKLIKLADEGLGSILITGSQLKDLTLDTLLAF